MTIENIGLERLPNIYFKKINLEDHNTKSFKVVSELVTMDEALESSFIWSTDPLLSGFMKTCIIETSNQDLIQQITDGVQNPYPLLLMKNPLSMRETKIHIFGFKDFAKMSGESGDHFRLKATMIKPNETANLVFFAFNYIDHKEMSNYLEIKLTGPLQQYMGPVVSEFIMTNQVVQESTHIFKKPNEETWSGPVHQSGDGEWYSGASSDSQETLRLTRRSVKNTKLTDARTMNVANRSSTKFSNLPIFSNLMASLNSEADLFGVFSINLRQLVLAKTESGRHIYGLGEDLFSSFVESISLNSIEIRRRQIRPKRRSNKLGTAKLVSEDIFPYTTVAATQESSPQSIVETENVRELPIKQDNHIRTFQFSDFEKSPKSRGKFIYEVHLTIIDKSQLFLENVLKDMMFILNGLEVEVRLLNKSSNYNDDLDSLVGDIPDVISSYIEQYYRYYSILKNLDQEMISYGVTNKKSLFTKDNYRKRHGEKFIDEWRQLISSYQRKFKIFPSDFSIKSVMPSSGFPANLVFVSKTFEEEIDFRSIKSSYDVLGISSNKTIATMTKDEFIKRGDLEIERFFDLSNSQTSDELLDLDKEDSNAIKDLETSKLNFLAPLSFHFNDQKRPVSNLDRLDFNSLSINFVRHIQEDQLEKKEDSRPKTRKSKPKRTNKKRSSIKRKRAGRLRFEFKPRAEKLVNLEPVRFNSSEEYLGDTSQFVNAENKLDIEIKNESSEQALMSLTVANQLSTKRSKKDFDLRERGNFYERFKSSKTYSPKKLRMMPISIKSILNSRSKAAKNNMMESSSDILKSVETKVASEILFQTNQKIEALLGYEAAEDGTRLLSQPIWGEVNKELLEGGGTFLCRATYLQMPEMGIVPLPEFKLKVQNSFFVIEGDETRKNPEVQIPDTTLSEVKDVIYASSNVVIQPIGVTNA